MNKNMKNSKPVNTAMTEEAISKKWGEAVSSGFTAIPNALIKSQKLLGISPSELTVLLNLLLHWWFKDDLPFPSSTTIATRTGMDKRTVQRHLKSLRDKGLIEKIEENRRRFYSLDGLQQKLVYFAKRDVWTTLKRPS